jgi:hypothetical protein
MITHWIATAVIGAEGVVGGILALVRWPPYVGVIMHLGYPAYLMAIIGFWYIAAGLVILVPRFPRAKEWAYARLFVNYAGAAASHLTVGDGAGALVAPVFFTTFLIASWALRPPARRLAGSAL